MIAPINVMPLHLREHTSRANGRYRRRGRNSGPRCRKCGSLYRAASTQQTVTYYYPTCRCAPPHGIPRERPHRDVG